MELWNWYNNLMDNYFSIAVSLVISLWIFHLWGKQEEKWKRNNNFSTRKKILSVFVYILLLFFGLPGILVFITPK